MQPVNEGREDSTPVARAVGAALAACFAFAIVAPARAQSGAPGVALDGAAPYRIQGDLRVAPGRYARPAGEGPALVAVGLRGATIDLRGVTLDGGSPRDAGELDRCRGVGLSLVDCEDVRVLGGELAGYRVCVSVERSRRVALDGLVCDGYFAQRLESTDAAEHPGDRLDPLACSSREWLERYGAAIALIGCEEVAVSRARARNGQNGLVLIECAAVEAYDNDFSYLSGWGIALDSSSRCTLARNRCEACTRGVASGWTRSQGAAGILITGSSTDVVVAFNGVERCDTGIGVFARSGGGAPSDGAAQGGLLLYQNDASRAVECGIAIEGSEDLRAVENRAAQCGRHGLSAADARGLSVVGNSLLDATASALSIHRAEPCLVARNALHGSGVGLEIEGVERAGSATAGAWIEGNSFEGNQSDVAASGLGALAFSSNVFAPFDGDLRVIPGSGDGELERIRGLAGFLPSGVIADSSIAAWSDPPEHLRAALATVPPSAPGEVRAYDLASRSEVEIGPLLVGEFGPWDPASGMPAPARRALGGALADATWQARWFSWADGPDPRGDLEGWRALAGAPLKFAEVRAWASPWAGRDDVRSSVGSERVGLVATAQVDLPGGLYELRVTSDDGVRVMLDGRCVLEDWTWHAPSFASARIELAPGSHTFVLEYFQVDGGAALSVDLEPIQS